MTIYTYTDRMAGPVTHSMQDTKGHMVPVHRGEVVFQCEAANILEADEKLLAATGLVASRQMSLCVSLQLDAA